MKRRNDKGFTLIELMVVITIIGLLAGITSVSVMSYLKKAKIETTKGHMRAIKEAIMKYRIDHNRLPSALADLCGPEGDENRYIESEEAPKDAWGNDFIYNPKDKRNYELISLGADNQEGGTGEDKDITLADLNKTTDEDTGK